MPDVHMRLVHYKRIANCRTSLELDSLQIELIDRFGLLPPPLKTLFAITALKLLAVEIGVAKIQAGADSGSITFAQRSSVDPTRLLKLIEGDAKRYRLDGPYKLRFSWTLENPAKRVSALDKLLRRLGAGEAAAAAA
jgi:transcription-repair coupling factor (superfamily II helicase)